MPPARISAVSAVVCNFNGEEYLADCLRSLERQEGLDEIIVVDDVSTDGSREIVREHFPDVQLIQLDENSGPGAARNRGLRAASHRWVLAVDNDAILRPDVLTKLRAALEEHPEHSIAQTRNVLSDEPERIHYDGARFHYVGLLALRNAFTLIEVAGGEGVVEGVVEADALIGICALMDRDAVLEAGGYDEGMFYLAEDYELSYRMRVLGRRLLAVEDALVLHRGGTAGLSFRGGDYPKRRAFLHSRNRWWILAKCYSVRTLLVALPGIVVYELVWGLFVVATGHVGAHLSGKLDFLAKWPEIRRGRRQLQSHRRVPDRALLVGGPLTLSPSLVASPIRRAAAGALNLVLRTWWALVRFLAA